VKFAEPAGAVEEIVMGREATALRPVSAVARSVTVNVPPRA